MLILLLMLQGGQQLPSSVPDPGVIATNQRITPAGAQSVFTGRVTGVRFGGAAGELWVAVGATAYRFAWSGNRILGTVKLPGRAGVYALTPDPVRGRMLASAIGKVPAGLPRAPGVAANSGAAAQLVAIAGDSARSYGGFGLDLAGAPAVALRPDPAGHRIAVLPLTANDALAVLDADHGDLLRMIPLGVAPITALVAADGGSAWVTELAGAKPGPGGLLASQCCSARAESIRVDTHGIAAPGSVAHVDLASGAILRRLEVGRHPTAAVWDERRNRLYVADGNSDAVSVVDTRADSLLGTIAVRPFVEDRIGLAPTALALAPDGRTLYVALAGVNAVAVYDLAAAGAEATLRGLIPTSWYPTTLDVSPDGRRIAVGSLLGVGSGTGEANGGQSRPDRYVHAVRGAVNVIEVPAAGPLAAFTVAVAANNRLTLLHQGGAALRSRATAPPRAVPERPGEPSLIDHVVFIIKENRTYDQVLGDLGRGDGDSSLVLYGRDVTPNTHALAEQFVTLDHFFASGGNSADGHQWLTQANETEYTLWPLYGGRSYPYDGTDPLAYSSGGFLWDAAFSRGKRVAVFGEYAPTLRDSGAVLRHRLLLEHEARMRGDTVALPHFDTHSEIPSLDRVLARDYPAFSLGVPDLVRSDIFLKHLSTWEREGDMPALVMIQLPSNHTAGTTAEWCTPKACVADNDLAVGRIVDRLSHSRFWPGLAIFVVEDDAQNGVDHVDGHRTVALAISPYTRRGTVDSTFYNQPSLLKTIELMLDLPALSLFDLVASDLGPSFIGPTEHPDDTPFTAITPAQSILAVNPRPAGLKGNQRKAALQSARMRFDIPDAAPSDLLNRILWLDARGWASTVPAVRRSLFFPMSLDLTDDEREAREGGAH